MDIRVGIGYDVHKLVDNRKLILGGVLIPYEKGLIGHSDADVLIHSIIDCLLGATKKGDIGKIFPDNDEAYKDANSLKMLSLVGEMLKSDNFEISNIDTVVIAQEPKIFPYIKYMEYNIANALKMDFCKISVKATTEEGLGFTGAGMGIASKSICLVSKG